MKLILFILFFILFATSVTAQQSIVIGAYDPSGVTSVLLRETDEPDALAELIFYNANVNIPSDNGDYIVEFEDITVKVTFEINVGPGGPDKIIITPPPGMYAEPSEITLMEGYSAMSFIYPLGMS